MVVAGGAPVVRNAPDHFGRGKEGPGVRGHGKRAEEEHLRRAVMLPDAAEGRSVYTTRPAGGEQSASVPKYKFLFLLLLLHLFIAPFFAISWP